MFSVFSELQVNITTLQNSFKCFMFKEWYVQIVRNSLPNNFAASQDSCNKQVSTDLKLTQSTYCFHASVGFVTISDRCLVFN